MAEYKTILKPVEDVQIKEKGSRFIGYAYPVENDAAAKEILLALRQKHPKATHHCFAYRLGATGAEFRAADDGEPSGSGGLPIYNQLLSFGVTGVLLVVVRYYGGTKLGVPGLIKAYKDCAKQTMEAAEIISKEPEIRLKINFPFPLQNQIFTLLNKAGAKIIDFETEERCNLIAAIPESAAESLSQALSAVQTVAVESENI